jgi:isopenicillin N synthase-like dioxygenase
MANRPIAPISITPISIKDGGRDKARLAQDLGECFARYGFAVIADHGIAPGLIADAFDRTRQFFNLPDAVKRRYIVANGGGQRGYTAFGIEQAKGADRPDLKEFWHVGRALPAGHRLAGSMPPNLTVTEIADFNAATYRLYAALDALGLRVLSGIALYLGLAPDFFDDKIEEGNSILRLLHYPPVSGNPSGARRRP